MTPWHLPVRTPGSPIVLRSGTRSGISWRPSRRPDGQEPSARPRRLGDRGRPRTNRHVPRSARRTSSLVRIRPAPMRVRSPARSEPGASIRNRRRSKKRWESRTTAPPSYRGLPPVPSAVHSRIRRSSRRPASVSLSPTIPAHRRSSRRCRRHRPLGTIATPTIHRSCSPTPISIESCLPVRLALR